MTKLEWQIHWAEVKLNPLHKYMTCPICQKRLKTKRSNAARSMKNEAYKSLGMKHVKGSLGGSFWE